jgi:16S rRNA (cytidine1402-2'-O)-methyltransferase
VGTLYVVGAPTGDFGNLTRRALGILEAAVFIVGDDEDSTRELLEHYHIVAPLALARDAHPDALAEGDVALLCPGLSPSPSYAGYQLIEATLDRNYPVVPVPGPSLAITALVVSGLPADSFVYLGELPKEQAARRELLAAVRTEHRSIIVLSAPELLSALLADLFTVLGDRPLALVASSRQGAELAWRGGLEAAARESSELALPGNCALVLGGAPHEAARWKEDRLRSEIQSGLLAGLGVKEISQQLAEDSGWSRRDIYRLSVKVAKQHRIQRGNTDAG